jgi:hypothetical protein
MKKRNDSNGGDQPWKKSALIAAAGAVLFIAAITVGINDNLPAIMTMLIGAFLMLFALMRHAGKTQNMKVSYQLLYWAPRTLGIVFAAFTSLFALDVFNEHRTFWHALPELAMHLLPTAALIIVLMASWRREWIGGLLFILFAVMYIFSYWGRFPLGTYLLIAGPLLLTGLLFLFTWRHRGKFRAR